MSLSKVILIIFMLGSVTLLISHFTHSAPTEKFVEIAGVKYYGWDASGVSDAAVQNFQYQLSPGAASATECTSWAQNPREPVIDYVFDVSKQRCLGFEDTNDTQNNEVQRIVDLADNTALIECVGKSTETGGMQTDLNSYTGDTSQVALQLVTYTCTYGGQTWVEDLTSPSAPPPFFPLSPNTASSDNSSFWSKFKALSQS